MKKRIWIVNYYTGSPNASSNPRYLELGKHFMAAGYDVITFNSTMCEPQESNEDFVERQYESYRFIHVKSPKYKGNGLKRMYSIFAFAWKLFMNCKKFDNPNVVLHNIHTPFDYPIVWMAKRLKAKYIAEAWDLWPEDFVTFGLVSRSNPALNLFYYIEKHLYYNADEMIFTFEGIYDYLKKKGWTKEQGGKIDLNKVHYINNGIDLEQFDKDKVAYPRNDEDINDPTTIKIIYLGSIRLVNDVKQIVDAAAMLKKDPRYRFFIYGDGKDRDFLEQFVKDSHIDNVVFKEKKIPLCEVAWVVSQAKVNIMNYEKGFGHVGVSSGKLWQYLAAGKPIVCNINIAYDDVITKNNLGVARDIYSAEEYAAEIKKYAEQPQNEYLEMCARVRKIAEEFDYEKLAARELEVID